MGWQQAEAWSFYGGMGWQQAEAQSFYGGMGHNLRSGWKGSCLIRVDPTMGPAAKSQLTMTGVQMKVDCHMHTNCTSNWAQPSKPWSRLPALWLRVVKATWTAC